MILLLINRSLLILLINLYWSSSWNSSSIHLTQDGTQTWRILGKKIDVELVSRIEYVYKYLSIYSYLFLSILIDSYRFLSILIDSYRFLSILIDSYRFFSILFHSFPFLSILIHDSNNTDVDNLPLVLHDQHHYMITKIKLISEIRSWSSQLVIMLMILFQL